MQATIAITPWHWAGFILFIFIFLALDLGVFHRRPHTVRFKEALAWTLVWFCLAMLFGLGLKATRGKKEALEFVTGYLIELSLSMDNVFVMAMIFAYFRVPSESRHRLLFWGVAGALAMRGVMIFAGIALVVWLQWILYVFGALLVFTGAKMMFITTDVDLEKNFALKMARKFYPVTPHLDGQKLVTTWNGRRALTPLALVLIMIETTGS